MPFYAPGSPWRTLADEHLRPLFENGRQPTRRELIDAYPFVERAMWPYKVWLQEVPWFRQGCPDSKKRQDARAEPLPGQEALL